MKIDITPTQFQQLRRLGAAAVPVLWDVEVEAFREDARLLSFHKREEATKTGVTQDFWGVDAFPPDHPFLKLAALTATALNDRLARTGAIRREISFNDFSLQRYPVSKEGQAYAISPHVDYKNCINLVAVYLLGGSAPFCVCADRSGTNAVEISAEPGDLILLRGTGFEGEERRPFHFVGPVSEERLTFGMRQVIGKPIEKHYTK